MFMKYIKLFENIKWKIGDIVSVNGFSIRGTGKIVDFEGIGNKTVVVEIGNKQYRVSYNNIKPTNDLDPFDEEDWDEVDFQLTDKYVFTIYRDDNKYYFNIGKIVGWSDNNFSVDYFDNKGNIEFTNINYPISSLVKDNKFVSSFTRSNIELIIFLDEDNSVDNIMKHKGIIDDFVNNAYFSFSEKSIGEKETFK